MKIKTNELTGPALDWAVDGIEHGMKFEDYDAFCMRSAEESYIGNWSRGGPIIEREGIEVRKGNPLYFPKGNEKGDHYEPLWIAGGHYGQTPLIAAMRCYVASKLGDEVEIPEELQ